MDNHVFKSGELPMDRTGAAGTVREIGCALVRVARPQIRDDECVARWRMPTIGSSSRASLEGA